jgi:hypothetical protein
MKACAANKKKKKKKKSSYYDVLLNGEMKVNEIKFL